MPRDSHIVTYPQISPLSFIFFSRFFCWFASVISQKVVNDYLMIFTVQLRMHTHGIAIEICLCPSVCLFVKRVHCENERNFCPHFNIV